MYDGMSRTEPKFERTERTSFVRIVPNDLSNS